MFSAFVSGTLTGQTRIRGVETTTTEHGHGILGVAEEFFRTAPDLLNTVAPSDAFNLHWAGVRAEGGHRSAAVTSTTRHQRIQSREAQPPGFFLPANGATTASRSAVTLHWHSRFF